MPTTLTRELLDRTVAYAEALPKAKLSVDIALISRAFQIDVPLVLQDQVRSENPATALGLPLLERKYERFLELLEPEVKANGRFRGAKFIGALFGLPATTVRDHTHWRIRGRLKTGLKTKTCPTCGHRLTEKKDQARKRQLAESQSPTETSTDPTKTPTNT